jgi:hypothetical protein
MAKMTLRRVLAALVSALGVTDRAPHPLARLRGQAGVVYSIARRTTNTTSGNSAHALITTSTDRAALLEAGVFMAAATASTYSLGRPAANGVTATSPVALLPEDPANPAGTTTSALAWSTSPTNPTTDLRRWASPATIGTGVIWTFPRGLLIAVSSNLVLQNLATNGVVDSYFAVDE